MRQALQESSGGGAENRTPVHESPLGSISRLSHRLGSRLRRHPLTRVPSPRRFGLSKRHTVYVRFGSPLSDAVTGTGDAYRAASLHYLGSECVVIVDV